MSAVSPEGDARVTSMTGFGSASAEVDGVVVRVELRSVNHRNLDVRFRMPPTLGALQGELVAALRDRVARGHVDVAIDVVRSTAVEPKVHVDVALARAWQRSFAALTEALDLERGASIELIAAQPGVAVVARPEEDADAMRRALDAAFAAACDALVQARAAEGARLVDDLRGRLETLAGHREAIAALAAPQVQDSRDRLQQRLAALLGADARVDAARLEQEVVLLADRSDVTEELVRLAGHLEACANALAAPPAGRTLGFLVQELLREVNTIGSKCNSLAITERVVAAKVEIEKIREQVLNLS